MLHSEELLGILFCDVLDGTQKGPDTTFRIPLQTLYTRIEGSLATQYFYII